MPERDMRPAVPGEDRAAGTGALAQSFADAVDLGTEVFLGMGKASRRRQASRQRERQRQRAAHGLPPREASEQEIAMGCIAMSSSWTNDAEYLEASRELAGVIGLRGLIAIVIEMLHMFEHLVPLQPLLPLPGTARPAAKAAARSTAHDLAEPADERLLSRIRALLNKAESTEFAEEAEALSARAQELMAKYSIDHALLAAEAGSKEEPGGRRIPVDNPYEAAKAALLQVVAEANRTARHQAVDDAVDEMFGGRLIHARAARVTDAEGWVSGRAAADLASLHSRASVADGASGG
jgi:hypothetical protein